MTDPNAFPLAERLGTVEMSPDDYERGRKFVEGLIVLKAGMKELGIKSINTERYEFYKPGAIMVVIPSQPIPRKLISHKYHKGPDVRSEDLVTQPFSVSSFRIDYLYDLTDRDMLLITGKSPTWESLNQYDAHFWSEEYSFDPREHQIAILGSQSSLEV